MAIDWSLVKAYTGGSASTTGTPLGGVKRKASEVAILAVTGLYSGSIHAICAANLDPTETLRYV